MALTLSAIANASDSGASSTSLATASFSSVGFTHLVVGTKHEGLTATISVTDNKGSGTLTALTKQSFGGALPYTQLHWGAIGTPGTGHIVTMTVSAARVWKAINVWLVNASLGGGLSLDVQAAGGSGTNSPISAGSLATSAATVSFALAGCTAGVTFTQGTGWTLRAHADVGVMTEDRNDASSGTYTASATGAGGYDWSAVAASFKETAGGSTTRGTPFGHRGTAFNGGRALQGPLMSGTV